MKLSPTTGYKAVALGSALVAAVACSKKSSDNNSSSPAPAPTPSAAPVTVVTSAPQPTPANPTGTTTTQAALAAVILNRADVTNPYTKANLVVNLGVVGGQISASDVIFQCKRETDTSFHVCPNGATYDFGTLVDGSTVTLDVQALTSAGATTAPDHIGFTVQLGSANTLPMVNASALTAATSGSVSLQWTVTQQMQGDRFTCAIDKLAAQLCTNPYPVNISGLASGSHSVTVTAIDGNNNPAYSSTVPFCAGQCPGAPGSTGPTAPLLQAFQLGSFYQYVIPQDMHVTEYSTTKDFNDQVEFYRVSTASDPTYIGNYACNGTFDSQISAASPNGTPFQYCLTTPPSSQDLKLLTDYRIANNHLEVSTNAAASTNEYESYIDFNVFDADYEYMQGRSRFEQLCLNRQGAIYVTPPIVNVINQNFWGNQVNVSLYICEVPLVAAGGLPSTDPTQPIWRNVWYVGAFFIGSQGLALPQPECLIGSSGSYEVLGGSNGNYTAAQPPAAPYIPNPPTCGTYKNPSLLEMTFVSKTPYPAPEYFAHDIMQNMQAMLSQITPISQ